VLDLNIFHVQDYPTRVAKRGIVMMICGNSDNCDDYGGECDNSVPCLFTCLLKNPNAKIPAKE
jgi:hypothetical protein